MMRTTALYAKSLGDQNTVNLFNSGFLKRSSKGDQYSIINQLNHETEPTTERGTPFSA